MPRFNSAGKYVTTPASGTKNKKPKSFSMGAVRMAMKSRHNSAHGGGK